MPLLHRLMSVAAVTAMALGSTIGTASAGPIIDPDTLQPPPPPGAECRADGPYVICHTVFNEFPVNEPFAELPCGTVYVTAADLRKGIRWYLDGKLVKRFVSQDVEGTLSLSPSGTGPTATLTTHSNWWIVFAVPGDESSGLLTAHGNGITIQAPGYGVIVHVAGLDLPDGTHRGVLRIEEDPAVAAELCAALGP